MKRVIASALLLSSACTTDTSKPSGSAFELRVAPLELTAVADACYDLAVYNVGKTAIGPASRVWSQTGICADRYGDEASSIAYIGTCDADPDGRINTASLVLEGLCKTDGCDPSDDEDPGTIPSDTWVNPCPAARPCLLERPCSENEDTLVAFDLTIARDAGQGFFDIGVEFADVFCSAKLDCVDALLHRPSGPSAGERDLTAVLAFACTSGADDTCLYANLVTIDCGGANQWTIDPSAGPGNIAESSPLLYAAAVYHGDEAYADFDKSYWNVALGLDESAFATYPNCTVSWSTTASEGELDGSGPYTTPAGTTYPAITFTRDVVVGGQLDCDEHALDVTLPGEDEPSVRTVYSEVETPLPFVLSDCAAPVCAAGDADGDKDGVPDACDTCPEGQTFHWVTWSDVTGNTATGTADGTTVTYTSSFPLPVSPGLYNHALFPAAFGIPNVTPTISNSEASHGTVTFSPAVTNPTMVIASLGSGLGYGVTVPLVFGQPVRLLWCQGLVQTALGAAPVACTGQMVDTIYGHEGYVVVEVPGTHSALTFDVSLFENYVDFVFGFDRCGAPPAPPQIPANGGFERGDTSGWSAAPVGGSDGPAVSVVSDFSGIVPTEGDQMALIVSDNYNSNTFVSEELDWLSVSAVCFDLRMITSNPTSPWGVELIAAPSGGQPNVATLNPASDIYTFWSFGQQGQYADFGAFDHPPYVAATDWFSACVPTAAIPYAGGDHVVPLLFSLPPGSPDQPIAFLIDNVHTIPLGPGD